MLEDVLSRPIVDALSVSIPNAPVASVELLVGLPELRGRHAACVTRTRGPDGQAHRAEVLEQDPPGVLVVVRQPRQVHERRADVGLVGPGRRVDARRCATPGPTKPTQFVLISGATSPWSHA